MKPVLPYYSLQRRCVLPQARRIAAGSMPTPPVVGWWPGPEVRLTFSVVCYDSHSLVNIAGVVFEVIWLVLLLSCQSSDVPVVPREAEGTYCWTFRSVRPSVCLSVCPKSVRTSPSCHLSANRYLYHLCLDPGSIAPRLRLHQSQLNYGWYIYFCKALAT